MLKIGENIRIVRTLKGYSQEVMKKLLLSIVTLLFSVQLCSAQSYAKLDTVIYAENIPFNVKMPLNSKSSVFSKVIDNHLFVAYIHKGKLQFEDYDLSTDNLSRKSYEIKLSRKNNVPYIFDFHVDYESGEAFVLTTNDRMLKLSLTDGKLVYSMKVSRFNYVFADKDFLYLGRYYNYKNIQNQGLIAKYSKDGDLLDSIAFNIPFPEFTQCNQNKLMTFNGQTFAVPLFDGYNILLIDKDFKTLNTFTLNKENWVAPSHEKKEIVSNDNNISFTLLEEVNNSVSRISGIDFLDNNNLLVRYFQNEDSERDSYIDILSFDKGNLKLKKGSILEYPNKIQSDVHLKETHVLLDIDSDYNYYSKGIIQIRAELPVEINSTTTYMEYQDSLQEKSKTENPSWGIWFFSFN